jgi:subfamily B ATP-binding cassette protein MsbA
LAKFFGIDPGNFFSVIIFVSMLYLTMSIATAILKTGSVAFSAYIATRTLHDLVKSLHEHTLSLPISFFVRQNSGDLISRFTNDSTTTVNLLECLIRGLIQSSIQTFLMLFLLIQADVKLAFALVAVGGGHFLITRFMSGWISSKTKIYHDFFGKMTSAIQESLCNIRVTKTFAAEEFDHCRVVSEVSGVRESLFRFRMARYAEEPIRLIADAFFVCGILLMSYYAMESGRLTKSGFGMFVFLASRTVAPISEFSQHFLSIFAISGSARRILEVFAINSKENDGLDQMKSFVNSISFERVCFSYGSEQYNLKDIEFEIKKGEMVALVGPSGGGKSTLCDLLLRLYNPSFGSIKIDGVDIKTYSKKSYLEKCGVVPQESLLLNASIKENILYGRPFDLEKFERSIRIANAIDFIADLPEKENTTVGDRGIRLSGGQKQRISIARAVYDNPEILILDEATSALDNESEKVVQDAIDKAIKSMTAIVVAHRLSTIRHASKIIVIDNVKVEAIGDHQKLMEISSVYRRLNSIHFSETEQTKNFRKDNQCLLI